MRVSVESQKIDPSELPARLYLDLLMRSLTDTLFTQEPDSDQPDQEEFGRQFIEHYVRGRPITMLPLRRLDNLRVCIIDVLAKKVPGDLIETGVWRGGATIFMRAILKCYRVTDRTVWVADSFEGLPAPDSERFPLEAEAHHGAVMQDVCQRFAVDLETVKKNFRAYGMLDAQVRFLKGWFGESLPMAPISALSVLRIDGDYYESTRDALTSLYKKVSIGGYIIVDDYGEDSWTYCRGAVDDFRREARIADPLRRVDSKCVFWKRTV